MSDAVKLARWIEWGDRETAHFHQHGESYDPANPALAFTQPEPERPDCFNVGDDELVRSTLARAVIEQAEELERLRAIRIPCPRCGRPDLAPQDHATHRASCMSRTDEEYEIDELKAALREALDADADDCHSLGDKRRAELRRLLT